MKTRIQTFLLLSIIVIVGCQNQKINPITETNLQEIQITFEDQVLKGKLIVSKVEGNKLEGELELLNKTTNRITFDFKDFVFKSGNSFGRLPNKEISMYMDYEKNPNFDQMSHEEREVAFRERHMKRIAERAKYFYLFDSNIQLEASAQTERQVELIFEDGIQIENLNFSYEGDYKRFLSLKKKPDA